jgi:phospholipase C
VRGNDPATVNLAYALDFSSAARTDAPAIAIAQGPFGGLCAGASAPAASSSVSSVDNAQQTAASGSDRFAELRAKADSLGFP